MEITVLGAHNSEFRTSRHTCFLIDSRLALDGGGLTSSLSLEVLLEIKAVLLTHSHYDHIRDIPALAMNLALNEGRTKLYSLRSVYEILSSHLLDGRIYPKFLELPAENPLIKFVEIEPGKAVEVESYKVLPLLVNHSVETVGFEVTSPEGKSFFYSGDTGPGLERCWHQISPQLMFMDVTFPNHLKETAIQSGHLTPKLLKEELLTFLKLKGYLPRVVAVHLAPGFEDEIRLELEGVAEDLGTPIELAREGAKFQV